MAALGGDISFRYLKQFIIVQSCFNYVFYFGILFIKIKSALKINN